MYRNIYNENGIYDAKPYEGISNILETINKSGIRVGVATLKFEKFAREVLQYFKLKKNIHYIFGVDAEDTLKKSDLIAKCIFEMKLENNEVVMVGDSMNDLYGAQIKKIDFIAAGYGYGSFDKILKDAKIKLVNEPKEILAAIDLNERVNEK